MKSVIQWGIEKQIFTPYMQNQPMLLLPNLDELIPSGDLVKVVNEIIERIEIKPLIIQYKGVGRALTSSNLGFT